MEWQTPAVSEKCMSRFGQHASVGGGDAGLGSTACDSTEDFCSSSGSPSFQPIRTQVPIPTAHVMPSTASKTQAQGVAEPQAEGGTKGTSLDSQGSRTSSSKSSPLPKSASSPNLDSQGHTDTEAPPQPDCLSRYRSLVNGLDHSLFPLRQDETHAFSVPAVEPTLNQSAMLSTFCPDPCYRLQMSGLVGTPDSAYRSLPETRTSGLGSVPHAWQGSEAASWQQQQLENLRLQVEQMKLLAAGSGQLSALYPTALLSGGNKWEAVAKTNETLLKEKELIIERQTQQMVQLEQRLRESELQVHSALLGRGTPYTDVCLLRLQEAQRENTFLRAQFAERGDNLAKEAVEAGRRLAATETEVRRLNEALREAIQKHEEEKKKQEERIRNRDKHISSLKKKCQKESEQNRERQQRIETLERYLADLPTVEDYKAQSRQLEEAQERTLQLQETVTELEVRCEEAQKSVREQEVQLEEQRQQERKLLATVTSLQARVQESLDDGARIPNLDVEKLRVENGTLREELQRFRKVVDKDHRLIEQLRSQIQTTEKQLAQEEGSSQALREELCVKDKCLLQLRNAMKDLSTQNQELMERNLTLQERLEEQGLTGEPGSPADMRRAWRRLYAEMVACLTDLQALCSVLNQQAHGRDPNLSLLLGVTPAVPGAEDLDDWQSAEAVVQKLKEVQQLRREIEALRTSVSDRYAQDMGDNCITQ